MLPSRDMAKKLQKRRKSPRLPTKRNAIRLGQIYSYLSWKQPVVFIKVHVVKVVNCPLEEERLHGKMYNERLTYVKHTLNVRYKTCAIRNESSTILSMYVF